MSIFRKSRMERVQEMLKSAASYTEDVLRDEQLRSNIRSAAGHAAVAAERVRKDSGLSGFAPALSNNSTTRGCRACTARVRAVSPWRLTWSTLAPRRSPGSVTSTW